MPRPYGTATRKHTGCPSLRTWPYSSEGLTNVHLFELALESHGVPYRTPAGGGFFTRQEVLDLTNLLGWLAEPDDDIALVGALRSPLFAIDDQTLLKLRSSRRPLLETLGTPPEDASQETRRFCTRAAEVLSELRSEVPFARPDALMEKALVLTGFEAAWAPLQGGDQALANIRKFVGLARTLGSHSLDELVTYIRRQAGRARGPRGPGRPRCLGRCAPAHRPRRQGPGVSHRLRSRGPSAISGDPTTPFDGAPTTAYPPH